MLTDEPGAIPVYQVDAFTGRPFAGNPAMVCLLAEPRDASWMQAVATEANLSETAFLLREGDSYHLRWFTPSTEVELCGHATLASAHVLWETGALPHGEPARFRTRSGLLTATRGDGWIEMDFPADPPAQAEPPPGLVEALGVEPLWVGRGRINWLVEVASPGTVRDVRPDLGALRRIPREGVEEGVIVTARCDDGEHDFVSRYFAPAAGVDEDPVTGSTHCCLGPYWGARLGKKKLEGYQASRRGGAVGVELRGERVTLRGRAVTVLRGELVPAVSGEEERP